MTQDFIFILPAGKERILREIELLTTFGGREGGVLRRKGIIGVDHIGGRALNIISNSIFIIHVHIPTIISFKSELVLSLSKEPSPILATSESRPWSQ